MSRLEEMLKIHEGERLKPYQDTKNKTTIGVGRNLTDIGISKEESAFLLANDIAYATWLCKTEFDFWHLLNEPRQDVMISLVFNMGLGKVKGFLNTLGAISNQDFNKAADELLASDWAKQVGQRARTLSDIMRSGVYPNVIT